MDDQFLYAELYPTIIIVIIALACAEFIGRSKHIGFVWTFFLMLGIFPGIIGLLTSNSAKINPNKKDVSQIYLSIFIALLAFIMLMTPNLTGENKSLPYYLVTISLFSSAIYLYKLYEKEVYNLNPKYYFKLNNSHEKISNLSKIKSLKNLNNKGILSDLEYENKIKEIKDEIINENIQETEEYKQLLNLLNSGLLSKEEFDLKIKLLKEIELKPDRSDFSPQR